jgi:C4-dicarboxylate-specific signal transduction histidine kinase
MLLHTMLLRRMLRLEVDVESPVLVRVALGSLTQIFVNLTLNALDAVAHAPEEERWIRLSVKQESAQVLIRFENGGQPIPKDVQRQLFKRGFSTKGEKGSGIGLFVSKRLATEAGGSLSYNPQAPHPCFELRLLSEIPQGLPSVS